MNWTGFFSGFGVLSNECLAFCCPNLSAYFILPLKKMSSYKNPRPDYSRGKHRIIIYSLIKLTDENRCVQKERLHWPAGCKNPPGINAPCSSARSRQTQPLRNCISHWRRRLASFPNKQAEWLRVYVHRVLPSLFSRIWTVSPISRMRAWHIGDRKLQITVWKKKIQKNRRYNKNRWQYNIYNHVIIVFIFNAKLPGEITLQSKVPSGCCSHAPELRCFPCTVSACEVAAATFLLYLLFLCFLISRFNARAAQRTRSTQEPLLSKL